MSSLLNYILWNLHHADRQCTFLPMRVAFARERKQILKHPLSLCDENIAVIGKDIK